MLYRSKISFACKDQEIKGALEPHVSADLLYASLGGTKPDDSYSFDRLDTLMRSLDKVRAFPHGTDAVRSTTATGAETSLVLHSIAA